MTQVLSLQRLEADEDVSLHGQSSQSISCKNSSSASWVAC